MSSIVVPPRFARGPEAPQQAFAARRLHFLATLLVALLAAPGLALGQTVHRGHLTLATQADVDAAAGITEVTGNLVILSSSYNPSSITSLDALSSLTSVGGDLTIDHNTALTHLDGLSSLTSVAGLSIYSNPALTNLDGLSSLTSVGGDLRIANNPALTNLDGLSSLTSVAGLSIYSNPALTNLDALSNLTSVEGSLSIYSNPALTNLDALSNLTSVGGDLKIESNAALTNCSALYSILEYSGAIAGTIAITGNAPGCNSTMEIQPRFIRIGSQADVAALSGYVVQRGDLFIQSTSRKDPITNLAGLSDLQSITGSLFIYDTDQLTNLDGLENLTSVGKDVIIYDNDLLTNVDGLQQLASVGGDLQITDNALLEQVDGLGGLTAIGGHFYMLSNPALASVNGLAALTTVGGDLSVLDNPVLASCGALHALLTQDGDGDGDSDGVGGRISFSRNAVGCSSAGEVASVTECPIPEISGKEVFFPTGGMPYLAVTLDAGPGAVLTEANFIDEDTGERFLTGLTASIAAGELSPVMPDYRWAQKGDGSQEATFHLTSTGADAFGYYVEITNSCGQRAYVDPQDSFELFATSTEEESVPGSYRLEGNYPNPFNPQTVIAYSLPESAQVRLAVYDAMGRQVALLADGMRAPGRHTATFEAGELPSGVYVYRLEAGSFTQTRSMLLVK